MHLYTGHTRTFEWVQISNHESMAVPWTCNGLQFKIPSEKFGRTPSKKDEGLVGSLDYMPNVHFTGVEQLNTEWKLHEAPMSATLDASVCVWCVHLGVHYACAFTAEFKCDTLYTYFVAEIRLIIIWTIKCSFFCIRVCIYCIQKAFPVAFLVLSVHCLH